MAVVPDSWKGRFDSTVPFYVQFREPYPAEFFQRMAARLGLNGSQRLLDVGCGPGPLMIGFGPFVRSCVGIDPEPGMLAAARDAAEEAGLEVELIQTRAEDLPETAGVFDLISIGRALHWVDRDAMIKVLNRALSPEGAIAICSAETSSSSINTWAKPFHAARLAWTPDRDERCYQIDLEEWFRDTGFRKTDEVACTRVHDVTAKELIGRALSMSTTSPAALGNRREAFQAALDAALAPYANGGSLQEEVIAVGEILTRF